MRGTKLGHVAIDAVLHSIGQTEDIFNRGASIAEIATWLECSKPTAKRWIDGVLLKNSDTQMTMDTWRKGHSVVYRYCLGERSRSMYDSKAYYNSYMKFAKEVWS